MAGEGGSEDGGGCDTASGAVWVRSAVGRAVLWEAAEADEDDGDAGGAAVAARAFVWAAGEGWGRGRPSRALSAPGARGWLWQCLRSARRALGRSGGDVCEAAGVVGVVGGAVDGAVNMRRAWCLEAVSARAVRGAGDSVRGAQVLVWQQRRREALHVLGARGAASQVSGLDRVCLVTGTAAIAIDCRGGTVERSHGAPAPHEHGGEPWRSWRAIAVYCADARGGRRPAHRRSPWALPPGTRAPTAQPSPSSADSYLAAASDRVHCERTLQETGATPRRHTGLPARFSPPATPPPMRAHATAGVSPGCKCQAGPVIMSSGVFRHALSCCCRRLAPHTASYHVEAASIQATIAGTRSALRCARKTRALCTQTRAGHRGRGREGELPIARSRAAC
jgi:hypothetical protein